MFFLSCDAALIASVLPTPSLSGQMLLHIGGVHEASTGLLWASTFAEAISAEDASLIMTSKGFNLKAVKERYTIKMTVISGISPELQLLKQNSKVQELSSYHFYPIFLASN